MNALRLRIAKWLVPAMNEFMTVEVPYRAAVVLLPPDYSWTEEDINHLNAALEAEVGHPVSAVMFWRSFFVDVRRSLP